jgi:hypothetical protein
MCFINVPLSGFNTQEMWQGGGEMAGRNGLYIAVSPLFLTQSLTGQCRCAHSKMTVPPEMKGYLHAAIMMAMVMVMAMEAAIIWKGPGSLPSIVI